MCKNGGDFIKCITYFLYTTLFVLGISVATVAGYTAFDKNNELHKIIVAVQLPGALTGLYVLFGVGIVISVIAILGCISVSSESRILIWLTFFLVFVLFIMQVVGVILCYQKYNVVQRELTSVLRESMVVSHSSSSSTSLAATLLRIAIGSVESKNKCCGFNGPQDYGKHIPSSCIPPPKVQIHSKTLTGDEVLEKSIDEVADESSDEEYMVTTKTGSTMAKKTTTHTTPSKATKKFTTSLKTSHPSTSAKKTTGHTGTPPTSAKKTTMRTSALSTSSKKTTGRTSAPSTSARKTTVHTSVHVTKHPPAPYQVGCIRRITPIVYAAGGIGLAVLANEFLLVLFIGFLLCDLGRGYENLA